MLVLGFGFRVEGSGFRREGVGGGGASLLWPAGAGACVAVDVGGFFLKKGGGVNPAAHPF